MLGANIHSADQLALATNELGGIGLRATGGTADSKAAIVRLLALAADAVGVPSHGLSLDRPELIAGTPQALGVQPRNRLLDDHVMQRLKWGEQVGERRVRLAEQRSFADWARRESKVDPVPVPLRLEYPAGTLVVQEVAAAELDHRACAEPFGADHALVVAVLQAA